LTPPLGRVERRLVELSERHLLPEDAPRQFGALLGLVAAEPASITAVRDPADGVEVHVADSLAGLEVEALRAAQAIADLGSGAGFPGLVLAIALPEARVSLVESVGRKADFLRRAVAELGLSNAEVVAARTEEWAEGRDRQDVVTARALASLPVLLEYAAPLLRLSGSLVAWKGRRDPGEEAAGRAAAAVLGMSVPEPLPVEAPKGAGPRHLYLSSKVSSTPNRFPRRPGMARKRPLGSSTAA
jgi:16S rRNA (guanine527-N7)-methyltransferase